MRRRTFRLLLALSLFAGLVPGISGAALASDSEPKGAVHSDNMTLVKQLQYEARNGTRANGGTDLEFTQIDVTDLESAAARGVTGTRTFSFAGSYDNGLQIVDVTDPDEAAIVGVYDCGVRQGDVQLFTREVDGVERTYAAYTQDTGYGFARQSACYTEAEALGFRRPDYGTFIADVTDPYNPVTVSYVRVPKGSHNQTVHPSGNYLYNSNSDLITSAASAGIEIYDIRDLAAPKHVTTLSLPVRPGLGTESHDLTFNKEGTRAYSAALSQTVIINTEDPEKPSIVTSFMDPAINVEHQSDPVTLTDKTTGLTREFLIIEDEVAGATPTGQCPNGGVHVYDITGPLELAPVKVGYWNIDDVRTFSTSLGCTAHVFEIHEEQALMTIAYYQGGVRVVDLSGLIGVALGNAGVGMKELGFYYFESGVADQPSNTWAVKAPFVTRDGSFEIYGNDQNRGMDIYRFSWDEASSTETGQWLTPKQALKLAQKRNALSGGAIGKPYCLLGDRV
ncbi:MAG TPA: hypothetical protein VM307_09385 [Egibacteraceae bacterium]|nr:hypothetical protein [Egibacteraceae bacterium]